jgi:AraC family transcriptional regulator
MAAVQRAVWYIESHSSEDLTLTDVAHAAGVSPFHLSRLFRAATGWPVARYIRTRRLSHAAAELAAGAPEILPLALSTGYGSHEAFTRAFRDAFGMAPEDVRNRGHIDGLATLAPLRIVEEAAPPAPPLRMESIGPLLLMGIEASYAVGDTAGIPSQWQQLFGEFVAHEPHPHRYGVIRASRSEGRLDYLAGFETKQTDPIPRGFRTWRLARQRYAVVRHAGHIGSIPRTWRALLEDWLPAAGLTPVDAPDFERYDADFDASTGDGGVDICVPVN